MVPGAVFAAASMTGNKLPVRSIENVIAVNTKVYFVFVIIKYQLNFVLKTVGKLLILIENKIKIF